MEIARETSGITTSLIVRYVRAHGGDGAVLRMLERTGMERTVDELEDERQWVSFDDKIALFEAASFVLGDPEVAFHVGESVLDQQVGRGLRIILLALGSPAGLLRNVAKAAARFSTVSTMRAEVAKSSATVSYQVHGVRPSRHDCAYTFGLLTQIGPLFGMPPLTVVHERCQVRGEPRCEFEVSWTSRRRLRRRTHAPVATETLALRAAALADQFDELQSAAADLVSSDEPDEVLPRIAARASLALRAQRHLLVLTGPDGRPSAVHHDGFDEASAWRAAEELLDRRQVTGPGSQIVVDILSARRHYGVLGAFHDDAGVFFPEESRLLAVYARHAAAALDMATALDESRNREATATALLDLARTLADVATPDETAQRLADAVLPVVACDRATVLLWEPDLNVERVAGASGWPDDLDQVVRSLVISAAEMPELAEMLANPRPTVYRRETAEPALASLLESLGLAQLIAVPLQAHGEFLGAVVAAWTPAHTAQTVAPDDQRVVALADQAATAIENARLLEQVQHQALHDGLTGLPNRLLLEDRLTQAVRQAERNGAEVSVLFLDLDHFKKVNDSLGHSVGNQLLCQAADRLTATLRASDTVARLGGDEFVVVVGGDRPTDVTRVADRLVDAFRRPFLVGDHELFVTASIGVATFPRDGATPESLVKRADAAMYAAKAEGRATWRPSCADVDIAAMAFLTLEADLHKALDRGELRVHYQPVVDLATGRATGVEALVRWEHGRLGFIGPDQFIPIAEESGLIVAIDRWVLRAASAEVARWNKALPSPVHVSVNVSARTLADQTFSTHVRRALRESGLMPECLQLEITERAALHDDEQAIEVLRALRRHGVRVAVDDFGTGYSMLCRLRTFPLDTLKIDRSFVQDDTGHGNPLLEGMVLMGHGLGLGVVAEGIETPEQSATVRALGCDAGQGYLFARPADAATTFATLSTAVTV